MSKVMVEVLSEAGQECHTWVVNQVGEQCQLAHHQRKSELGGDGYQPKSSPRLFPVLQTNKTETHVFLKSVLSTPMSFNPPLSLF